MMEFKLTIVAASFHPNADEMYLIAQGIDEKNKGSQARSKPWNPKCEAPDLNEFAIRLGTMLVDRFAAEDGAFKNIKEKHAH